MNKKLFSIGLGILLICFGGYNLIKQFDVYWLGLVAAGCISIYRGINTQD